MSEEQGLKDAGLKITAPRLKILQLLESTSVRHVSAEDVYKLLLENGEEIGLATVYRVLTQFEDAGLVARHHFEGGHSVFELSPDQLLTKAPIAQSTAVSPSPAWIVPESVVSGFCVAAPGPISALISTATITIPASSQ